MSIIQRILSAFSAWPIAQGMVASYCHGDVACPFDMRWNSGDVCIPGNEINVMCVGSEKQWSDL